MGWEWRLASSRSFRQWLQTVNTHYFTFKLPGGRARDDLKFTVCDSTLKSALAKANHRILKGTFHADSGGVRVAIETEPFTEECLVEVRDAATKEVLPLEPFKLSEAP